MEVDICLSYILCWYLHICVVSACRGVQTYSFWYICAHESYGWILCCWHDLVYRMYKALRIIFTKGDKYRSIFSRFTDTIKCKCLIKQITWRRTECVFPYKSSCHISYNKHGAYYLLCDGRRATDTTTAHIHMMICNRAELFIYKELCAACNWRWLIPAYGRMTKILYIYICMRSVLVCAKRESDKGSALQFIALNCVTATTYNDV